MRRILWLMLGLVLFALNTAAQENPKAEIFGGYSYLHSSIAGDGASFNGGSGSLAFNMNKWFGVVGDIGVYHHSSSFAGCGECTVSATDVTYLFGRKVAYRENSRFTPYAHLLFGGAHQGLSFGGASSGENAFALALGGGFDARVSPRIAVRIIQVDYLRTSFTDGVDDRQNNARISTGIVVRLP